MNNLRSIKKTAVSASFVAWITSLNRICLPITLTSANLSSSSANSAVKAELGRSFLKDTNASKPTVGQRRVALTFT